MSEIKLRDYQENGNNQVARLAKVGIRRIVYQGPTGSGKTVTFAGLSKRFWDSLRRRIVIAVHREELLRQTARAIKNVAGLEVGLLIAEHKTICQEVAPGIYIPCSNAKVVICMVETLNNRIKKYEQILGDVGMLIVDECHIGNFNKIYEHFPTSLIIGFTATPISASKKIPLKTFFDDIVSPVSIQHLIDQGHLAKNITISVKNGVNRKSLKVRGGEFDERIMASIYSQGKHVKNTVKAYEQYALGEKTVIFNCNIAHSQLVTQAFVEAGLNCRHLDGNAPKQERLETLKWLAETHDAILSSVNLVTTGFDEPTVRVILVNRATMSLTLWLQMTGRGSRPIPGVKDTFKIIDLGSNVATHLDWNYPHDWKEIFHNPDKPRNGTGPAPTKLCGGCEAMIHLSARICPFCGYDNARQERYDIQDLELEVITKGVDIQKLIEENASYSPYKALHMAKVNLCYRFRNTYKGRYVPMDVRMLLNERYQILVEAWCKQNSKPYNRWHKDITQKWLLDELDRMYGPVNGDAEKAQSVVASKL